MHELNSLLTMLIAKLTGVELPDYFTMLILVMAGSLLVFALMTRRLSVDKPKTGQHILELLIEGINKFQGDIIGHDGSKYISVCGTFFVMILLCNLMGFIPGFMPPTGHIIVTLSFGLCAFLAYNAIGVYKQGFGYIKHFLGPMLPLAVLFLPIEMVSHIARPMSLGIRLFGNIFGDHMVGSIFTSLVPIIIPVPFILLGLFVSFMQALVFALLSMIYIAGAVEHH